MARLLAGALACCFVMASALAQDQGGAGDAGETVLSPRQIAIEEAENRMRDFRRRGLWRDVVLEADRIMAWDAEHGTASLYRRIAVENLQKAGLPVPTPAPPLDPAMAGAQPGATPAGAAPGFGAAPSPFGGQPTAPFGGGQQAPPFGSPPPFGGGQQNPPFGGGQQAPPFGGGPPPFGGQQAPPFGGPAQPGGGPSQGSPFDTQGSAPVFGGSQPVDAGHFGGGGASPFSGGGAGPFGGAPAPTPGAQDPFGGGAQPAAASPFGGSEPVGGLPPESSNPFGGSTAASPFGGQPDATASFGGTNAGGEPAPSVPAAFTPAPEVHVSPNSGKGLSNGLMIGGGILGAMALLVGGVKLYQGRADAGGAPKKKSAGKKKKGGAKAAMKPAPDAPAGGAKFKPLQSAGAAGSSPFQAEEELDENHEEDVAPTAKARKAPKPADLMAAISENSQLDMLGGASVGAEQDLFDPSKMRRAADAGQPSPESDSVNELKTVVSAERREAAPAPPKPQAAPPSGSIDLSGLSFGFGGESSASPSAPADSAPTSLTPRDSAFGTLFGEGGAGKAPQAQPEPAKGGGFASTPNFGGLSAFDSSRPVTREGDKIPGAGGMAAAFDAPARGASASEGNPFEETGSSAPSGSGGGGFGELFGGAASAKKAEGSPFGSFDIAETSSAPSGQPASPGGFGSEFLGAEFLGGAAPTPAKPAATPKADKKKNAKEGKPQALFDSSFLDFGGVKKKPAETPAAPAPPAKGSDMDDILFSAETMAPNAPAAAPSASAAPPPAPGAAFDLTAHSALFGGLDATGGGPVGNAAPAAPSKEFGGFGDLELTATSNPFGSAFGAPPEAPTAETVGPFGSAFSATPAGGGAASEASPFDLTIGLSDMPAPPEETTLITLNKAKNASVEAPTAPAETVSPAAREMSGGMGTPGGIDQRPSRPSWENMGRDGQGGPAFDATMGLPDAPAAKGVDEPTVSLRGQAAAAGSPAKAEPAKAGFGGLFQGKPADLDATMAAPLSGESGRVAANKHVEVSARDSFAMASAAASSEERRKSRSASLLQEQKTLAEKSAQSGDWVKAVHYYSIAAALAPNDQSIKSALANAREQRKAATGK